MTAPLLARQYLPIGDARGSTEVPAALRRYVRAIGDVVLHVTTTATLTRTQQVVAVTGGTYTITMPASPQDGDEHQFIYGAGSGTVTISDGGSFSQTMDAVGEVLTAYYDKTAWVPVEDNRTVWGGGDVSVGNISASGTLGCGGVATIGGVLVLNHATLPEIDFVDGGNHIRFSESAQQFKFTVGAVEVLVGSAGLWTPAVDSATSLGTTSLRWSDFFTDAMTCGGAAALVGTVYIGTFASGNASLNLFTGAAGSAEVNVHDGTNSQEGGWYYDSNSNTMGCRAGNAVRTVLSASEFYPATDSATSLGATGNRWSDFFTDAMTCGGTAVLDGAIDHNGSTAGFFSATPAAQVAVTAALTDNTGATPDNTIANVPAATAADVDVTAASLASTNASLTALENNVSALTAKVNNLLAFAKAHGLMASA